MKGYPVTELCALAGMSRQAFYKRDEDALFRRLALEQFVAQFVREVRGLDPRMGSDKLWLMYSRRFGEGFRVGRDTFRCILHERGLCLRNRRRAVRTTDSRHGLPTYPNLVRNVIPVRPNQIWVSDITYIAMEDHNEPSGYRFCFLTMVMDAYSKRILGWCVAPTLEAKHTLRALRMAIATLPDGFCGTIIHHSDRGVQYVCGDYVRELLDHHITPSMTEDGNPKDNAMAERINSTMKNELLYGMTFTAISQVAEAVGNAVGFYNGERPHSSLDWHTPDEAHRMEGELKRHWHSWREDSIRRLQDAAVL